MQSKKLKETINYCKICFKKIEFAGISNIFHRNCVLCSLCQNRFIPTFELFTINGVKGLAIYDYDANIKELLYQLKGCKDYELASIFISPFKHELSLRYKDYVLLPIPSYKEEDLERGFNHVLELFKSLNLPFENLLEKTEKYKQSDHSQKDRENIKNVLKIKDINRLNNKKVLIVDDVMTTGSTIRAVISLLKEVKVKKLEILVMSKTKFNLRNQN